MLSELVRHLTFPFDNADLHKLYKWPLARDPTLLCFAQSDLRNVVVAFFFVYFTDV